MSDVYTWHQGDAPLLISVPHDGRELTPAIHKRVTPAARRLPDTDWHVARLYEFAAELGASTIVARYSRYVVDLNRPSDDTNLYEGQVATGLCPRYTFDGEPLYIDDASISDDETEQRVERYWRPYHERLEAALDELRSQHGYALLWDAHSIPSKVPLLFGGKLPVLNIGTWGDRSCDPKVSRELLDIASNSPYSAVLNGRFVGGYITRRYGRPERGVQAVQLETAQRAYMDEETGSYDEARAARFRETLQRLLETYMAAAVQ